MRRIFACGMLALVLLAGRAIGGETKSVKDHEAGLLAQLKAAKNPMDRVRVLRLLPAYGGAAAVPVVAPLLDEPDELVRVEAARALQPNPSPEAGKALVAALERAREPHWRIALLEALAARRETGAAKAASHCLQDADAQVVEAAARAVGRAGGSEAAAALKTALGKAPERSKLAIYNSYVDCADGLRSDGKRDESLAIYQEAWKSTASGARVRGLLGLAAVQGTQALPAALDALRDSDSAVVAVGLRVIRTLPGDKAVAAACVAEMPKLSNAVQALAWYTLAARGDASVLPSAIEAVKSDALEVKRAALWAVGTFGDASCIPVALPLAANGEGVLQAEARRTLRRLHSKETPRAMLALLPKADPKMQIELIGALADTGVAAAVPQLLAMVSTSQDAKVRSAAYGGLRLLGDTSELPVLVEGLVKGVRPGDEEAATQAIAHIVTQGRDPDAAIGVLLSALRQATAAGPRARLVGLLGRTGSAKALPAVRQAAADGNETIQDAGIRALAQWPDGAVAGDLLALAHTSPKETHRALALRGYVRLVHVPRQRPAEEKLAMCREAFALSRTADEKKLVLGALGDVVSPAALNMAVGLLSDEPVREEAAVAVLRIAGGFGGDLKRPDVKESARAALNKVLEASKNDDVRKGVLALMKRIDG